MKMAVLALVAVFGTMAVLPIPLSAQATPAQPGPGSVQGAGPGDSVTPQPRGRRINRRTYHVYPAKYQEALALAKEMRDLSQRRLGKTFTVMTVQYGPTFHTFVFEFDYETREEQDKFSEVFYPLLREGDYVNKWFALVHGGTNEMWLTH